MKSPNNKKSNDIDYDYLTTSSARDCTGLIPAGITEEEELEYYQELYPFLPKAASKSTNTSEKD